MTEIDWDNLPLTTIPTDLGLTVKGFENEEGARELGHAVLDAIMLFGRFMDLSALDGVTVAIDYDQALSDLDRGLPGLRPLTRSNTAEMQGVAMSPAVMRDGQVKTHLVFNAQMVAGLTADIAAEEDKAAAIGIIAHECAHVQVTAQKEAAIPEARFGTRIEGYERAVMFQIAEVCWDEYAACRISALFNRQQTRYHGESMIETVAIARDRANAAIKAYRIHADIDQLVGEAGPALAQPIKIGAYLLGGMDGEGFDWTDVPDIRTAIVDAGYDDLIDELHSILRELWDSQGTWDPNLATFEPLIDFAHEVFADGGLIFHTEDDGRCHIDVPFSPETMPDAFYR